MTESIKLPLRLPGAKTPDHGSLKSRIIQIHAQKGAFRTVTEASLTEEIRSGPLDEDADMADTDEVEAEDPERRYENVMKSREDMIQQLRSVAT
jgi:hypothetical protein